MFVVQDTIDESIDWPVVVETPVAGGKSRKYEFTGTFRRLSDDEKKAIEKEVEEMQAQAEKAEWIDGYVERTMKIMTNWRDVVDPKKNTIEYTRENLKKAVMSPSGMAIINGIYRAMNQIESGVKAKN